jgi:hypothetical protein
VTIPPLYITGGIIRRWRSRWHGRVYLSISSPRKEPCSSSYPPAGTSSGRRGCTGRAGPTSSAPWLPARAPLTAAASEQPVRNAPVDGHDQIEDADPRWRCDIGGFEPRGHPLEDPDLRQQPRGYELQLPYLSQVRSQTDASGTASRLRIPAWPLPGRWLHSLAGARDKKVWKLRIACADAWPGRGGLAFLAEECYFRGPARGGGAPRRVRRPQVLRRPVRGFQGRGRESGRR